MSNTELKLNGVTVLSENNGDITLDVNQLTGATFGELNFNSTNHQFTLKGVDAPIVGANYSTNDDANSGQLAIYNDATKLWGITEQGWIQNPNVPCISGQLGSASHFVSDALILFEEFWIQQGITYNSTTRRFTVPVNGIYRITMNPFFQTGYGGGRVYIGVNNDSPGGNTHYGHCYRESATYDTACLNSIVSLSAGDYIVFRLQSGRLYNATSDRFNQFTIQLIG